MAKLHLRGIVAFQEREELPGDGPVTHRRI
jgi:hypothetical protein